MAPFRSLTPSLFLVLALALVSSASANHPNVSAAIISCENTTDSMATVDHRCVHVTVTADADPGWVAGGLGTKMKPVADWAQRFACVPSGAGHQFGALDIKGYFSPFRGAFAQPTAGQGWEGQCTRVGSVLTMEIIIGESYPAYGQFARYFEFSSAKGSCTGSTMGTCKIHAFADMGTSDVTPTNATQGVQL